MSADPVLGRSGPARPVPGRTRSGRFASGRPGDGVVDLRSDTVTRSVPDMVEAMAAAEVGDDVFGEDPTTNRLEAEVAALLGHEAGLFTPTGSMANVLGVGLLVGPGEELLCDVRAHVVRAELGAHAVHGQVTTRTWTSPDGRLDAAEALALAEPDAGPYLVSTAAFAVENTHNFGGGTVQPLDQLRALRDGAAAMGVGVHLDGARLWNAHVATGVPLVEYGACADTVSVCLSKGLGAPVGSVLVSSAERIATARVRRKRLGGGMRQTGVLAGAGRYALAHHIPRLAEDHRRARELAEAVAEVRPDLVDPGTVQTNIVVLDLSGMGRGAAEVADRARAEGVLLSVLGPRTVRLVTHLDVDDEAVAKAVAVLTGILG
ncbi:MAG: GntG family PLP-dependent aldolase [Kineosporiaceae bacterium]